MSNENGNIDQNTKITLTNGEEVSLQELRDGYLRQADYTQKTQTLSDQKKQIESNQEQYQTALTFQQNMQSYFAEDPNTYQKIKKYYDTGEVDTKITPSIDGEGSKGGSVEGKEVSPFAEEVESLKKQVAQSSAQYQEIISKLQGDVAGINVDKAVNQLENKYNIKDNAIKQEVLNSTSKNYNSNKDYLANLEDNYKIIAFDDHKREMMEEKAKMATQIPTSTDANGSQKQMTEQEQFIKALSSGSPKDMPGFGSNR